MFTDQWDEGHISRLFWGEVYLFPHTVLNCSWAGDDTSPMHMRCFEIGQKDPHMDSQDNLSAPTCTFLSRCHNPCFRIWRVLKWSTPISAHQNGSCLLHSYLLWKVLGILTAFQGLGKATVSEEDGEVVLSSQCGRSILKGFTNSSYLRTIQNF